MLTGNFIGNFSFSLFQIGGILLSVICGVGIIFMVTTHFLSRRKFNEINAKTSGSSNRHIVLRRRPDGAKSQNDNDQQEDKGLLRMT